MCIINKLTKEELEILIKQTETKTKFLNLLGLIEKTSKYYKILNARLQEENLQFPIFRSSVRRTIENVFCENSTAARSVVKKWIIKLKLFEYKCHVEGCPIIDIWLDKKVSLQLDHKNGINNDHRLENLRWICPMCHSQTDTFCGRNIGAYTSEEEKSLENVKKRIFFTCKCGETKCKISKHCSSCEVQEKINSRIQLPEKETLEKLMWEKPMQDIAKEFGMTDNGLRKRMKKLGIVIPPMRGFWQKKKAGLI